LLVGTAFDDALGELLRILGLVAVLLACLTVTFRGTDGAAGAPPWAALTYPLVMAGALAVYGALLRQRPWLIAAALALVAWAAGAGWRGYLVLRQTVAGLDHMAVGLALFGLAVLISLGKAGAFSRRRPSESQTSPPQGPAAPG
jgi:hypothetical protein